MNDRFKFRAVLKTDRFTILVEPFYILNDCYFIDVNKAEVEFECKYPEECFWDFIDEIKKQDYIQEIASDAELIITRNFTNLVQCTGLHDKNGKLIYEGDIVTGKDHFNRDRKCIVEYSKTYCCYFIVGDGWSDEYMFNLNDKEVIGNIYENLELLNG